MSDPRATRTVLVTGASSGIGAAVAARCIRDGYRVILAARRIQRLTAMIHEWERLGFSDSAIAIEMDVTKRAMIQQALDTLPPSFAQIDILINNAGIARELKGLDQGEFSDWDAMIDTNLKGVLAVTHAVLPALKQSKSAHILNIGSTAGKMIYPKGNVYCVTKAAIDMLTQAMRVDLLFAGIKVTAIHPGAVETEFSLVRFKGDTRRAEAVYQGYAPLAAEDVADAVAYCLGLPPHVCVNDLVLTPTAQANSVTFQRG